jgi:electron-transferring-flavoprotein dehydrogenase
MSNTTTATQSSTSAVRSSASHRLTYDVLLVGGSPSNLALAHRLLDLAEASKTKVSIAILEKSKEFGGHICSGAVVQPRVFKQLFPNYQSEGFPVEGTCSESYFSLLGEQESWNVPNWMLPEGLQKEGYWILSLSLVVAWMAQRLKEKASQAQYAKVDLYPGFAAHETLYDGDRVVGVSVVEDYLEQPLPEEHCLFGALVVFGDKGTISGDVMKRYQLRETPQIWSVGVKEVWQLPESAPSCEGKVWHTLGYPLTDGTFGGGFVYGMKNRRITVGLIASLDTPNPNLNPQQQLQEYKKHPWLQNLLKGATLQKYGAALLPEGGYYSLPKSFSVDGALFVGDALGVLNVSNLNGVANSVESGMLAAEVIHELMQASLPFTGVNLLPYKGKVLSSSIGESLKEGRYFRSIWMENPRLLGVYLPHVLEGVDKRDPVSGFINVGLKENPVQALVDAGKMGMKLEALWNLGKVSYKADHEHLSPNYASNRARSARSSSSSSNGTGTSSSSRSTRTLDASLLYNREDAVFYAGTRYHHGNEHIDEFNAEVCQRCITAYSEKGFQTPCVSDCTAEVHRVDSVSVDGLVRRIHGMSLENCVQCRTCEIVCPEQNLKVKPTAQGAGPDFMGL